MVCITKINADTKYEWFCKENASYTHQRSVIESSVYKNYRKSEFESPTEDVLHCEYNTRSYFLVNGTMLICNKEPRSNCAFEKCFTSRGKLYGNHFVTQERDIVLTFKTMVSTVIKTARNTAPPCPTKDYWYGY